MSPWRPLLSAVLAALAAANAPAHAATVGPIENLPAAEAIGREAFPVDPIGRTWTYRRGDGTTTRREIQKPDIVCLRIATSRRGCVDRALATFAAPASDSRNASRRVTMQVCDEGVATLVIDEPEQPDRSIGAWEISALNPPFPLVSGAAWSADSNDSNTPRLTEKKRELSIRNTSYRVQGKARVEVSAGTFPVTAVVASIPTRDDAPPPRRVFFAANVGPVLEQVKDAAGNWITDLELESYEVKPTTVVVESDREAERIVVPAPAGATAPSRAEVGPLDPIPDGAGMSVEMFPMVHRIRWTYRTPADGSSVQRGQSMGSRARDSLAPPSCSPQASLSVSQGRSTTLSSRYFVCSDRIEWANTLGLVASPRLAVPLPLSQGRSWATDAPAVVHNPGSMELNREHREHVMGRTRVVTPAGSFEHTVLIETTDLPERPIRRTYYAANVGPVLVLVPEGDRWVAERVLESISVPAHESTRRRAATGAAPTNQPHGAAAPRGTTAPPAVEADRSLGRPVVRPAP